MKQARMMLLTAALAVGAYAQSRPHNPFVEKVVTPLRSRQLKVALNNDLWIMYDIPNAELYMAWAGGTGGGTLKNATYWYGNQVHFPHWFYPDGTKYFETQVGEMFSPWTPAKDIDTYYSKWPKQPRDFKNWSVTSGGAEVFDYVANHGYFTQGNIFKFHNGLKLKGGAEIDVMEIPEGEGKKLTRKITFTGTNGATVKLKLPGGPGWAVSGKGRLEGGSLVQDGDGESTITVQF